MMGNEDEKTKPSEEEKNSAAEEESKKSSLWSYRLVVIMLAILAGLVVIIVLMPLSVLLLYLKDSQDLSAVSEKFTEYSKWALSVLLGAFGAWIGAGAAYFFGKENLRESSRSTEKALSIQQGAFRRSAPIERIKDMTLTAVNSNFIFHPEDTKAVVKNRLANFKGYWFVPVVDEITGKLEEIIHAQVFWDTDFGEKLKLTEVIALMDTDAMDKKKGTKKLHGESFYVEVSPNDKVGEVYNLLREKDAEVVIVVDEKGKPSHCLTKTELRTFLKVND
jgi:predicted transcriptional regulator/uncharacterized membrane protein YsdA (DUF1294 family)